MIHNERGFSLIEVLVSLVIIAVGLLGIAKIQALAYGETGTASLRSLAAIEAASMAASMRANRGYWSAGNAASPLVSISGSTVTFNDTSVPASATCNVAGTPCTTTSMARYDTTLWATALVSALGPSTRANITCSNSNNPVTCTIVVLWTEKAATATPGVTASGALVTPDYTLYVEP